MLFNSYLFIFMFLPLVWIGYCCFLQSSYPSLVKIFLFLSSLFFYGYWNLAYVPLLLGSILSNYLFAYKISTGGGVSKTQRKLWLILGIAFNLFVLGFFKYTGFFLTNLNLAFSTQIPIPSIILPLAISFFTFQQIAYLCDCYKYQTKNSILDYCLFIVFFPQLIAGPIVHHKEMIPQFQSMLTQRFNAESITKGLFIFSIGLFKKVVIADYFSEYADRGFSLCASGDALNFIESWLTSLAYTFQLYFDFSGYCDMAIGIALLFNITLPINFNSPYKALNIQDFWKRWHITLGRFLTQYLYIPLGGSKQGRIKTLRNLGIVFILSGIWHGAGWGFIIWGILHAAAMIIHRIYHYCLGALNLSLPQSPAYKILCWIITFNFINVSWVFFRSDTLEGALNLLKGMIGWHEIKLPSLLEKISFLKNISSNFQFGDIMENLHGNGYALIGFVAYGLFHCLVFRNAQEQLNGFKPNYQNLVFLLTLSCVALLYIDNTTQFLYFNF